MQVAMVTGAGSGIGREVCERLLLGGVAVAGLDLAKARRGLTELSKTHKDHFLSIIGDVTKPEDAEGAVARALERFGGLDMAVNCAGIWQHRTLITELSLEDFQRVMAINVTGVFLSMKAQLPALISRGGGAIVNIASVAGLKGTAGLSAYVASKHAVLGLTRCAALENARHGIRINAICPGLIDTPMMAAADDDKRARLIAEIPLKRLGTAQDIAQAVLWLLSPAASFCVGSVLTADGGMLA